MSFLSALHQFHFHCHFFFSNEEDEQIFRLRVIIENNVIDTWYLFRACIVRLTELQRSCQQIVASFALFLRESTKRL